MSAISGALSATQRVLALAVGGLIICLLVELAIQPMLIDNGDYYRVLVKFISFPPWVSPQGCLPLHPIVHPFGSTMGAVFQITSWVLGATGQTCVDSRVYAFALFGIVAVGSIAAVAYDRSSLPLIVGALILAVIFAPFLSSFYEEAIVVPIVIWTVYGYSRLQREGKPGTFVISAAMLAFSKSQMILLVPVLLYLLLPACKRIGATTRYRMAAALIILLAAIAVNAAKFGSVVPNQYNRLFNGVGWASLGVSDWPAQEFSSRLNYFYDHRATLEPPPGTAVPPMPAGLLGTSYWPTGVEILENGAQYEDVSAVLASLKPSYFARVLIAKSVFANLFVTALRLSVSSDYSVQYLQVPTVGFRFSGIVAGRDFLLRHFGLVYLGCLVACVVILRGWDRLIGVTCLVAMPLVIAIGDGFYEFEKHFAAYFMCLPVIFLLRLREPAASNSSEC
jgi:hypothetical protein